MLDHLQVGPLLVGFTFFLVRMSLVGLTKGAEVLRKRINEIIARQRKKGVYLSHLLQLQFSGAQGPTMFGEIWIMLYLSFDFLLQTIELVTDGLPGRSACQLRFFGGERMMCTYGALSKFRTEANSSGVVLRRIISVPRCTGAQIASWIVARLRHVGVSWKERK